MKNYETNSALKRPNAVDNGFLSPDAKNLTDNLRLDSPLDDCAARKRHRDGGDFASEDISVVHRAIDAGIDLTEKLRKAAASRDDVTLSGAHEETALRLQDIVLSWFFGIKWSG